MMANASQNLKTMLSLINSVYLTVNCLARRQQGVLQLTSTSQTILDSSTHREKAHLQQITTTILVSLLLTLDKKLVVT